MGWGEKLEQKKFASRSSDNMYTAVRYNDGTFSCDCKGWTIKRKGWSRYCSHTGDLGDKKTADGLSSYRLRKLLADRLVLPLARAVAPSSAPSRTRATTPQPDRARITFDEEV